MDGLVEARVLCKVLAGFHFSQTVLQDCAGPRGVPREKQLGDISCHVSVVPLGWAYLCHVLFPYLVSQDTFPPVFCNEWLYF